MCVSSQGYCEQHYKGQDQYGHKSYTVGNIPYTVHKSNPFKWHNP